jgi:hypothetical protein
MAWVVAAVTAAFAEGATAAVIAEAVSAVGIATSVVGAVTGSKDLMKIGAIVGLAGGVGSLATAAFGGAAAAGDAAVAGAGDAAVAGAGDAATDAVGNAAADTGTQAYSVVQGAGEMPGSILSSAAPADSLSPGESLMPSDPSAGAATQPSMTPGAGPTAAATPPAADPTSPSSTVPTSPGAGATGPSAMPATPDGTTPPVDTTADPYANETNKFARQGAGFNTAGTGNSTLDQLKAKLGSAWDSLPPTAKAEMLKAALAVPGAIQAQNNKANELALQQQKVNQTSFGSSAPRARSTSILQRATAKG